MKKDRFLIDSQKNTQDMVRGIQQLLESTNDHNIKLALQIMEGGGVPSEFQTHLFAIRTWHADYEVQAKANTLFKKIASPEVKRFVDRNWKKEYLYEFNEVKIAKYLEILSSHPKLDKRVLGLLCLRLTKKGGKFCLEQQLASNEFILSQLVFGKELYLANFELKQLPREIGLFREVRILNISGNRFQDIPVEISQLSNLESLYYTRTPLAPQAIRFLEKSFPKIFALKYYNEASDLSSDEQYLKAALLLKKATELLPDFAEAWLKMGSSYIFADRKVQAEFALHQVLDRLDQRLIQNPSSACDWFLKSCVYVLLDKKIKAFNALAHCIQLNSNYKLQAGREELYEAYHNDQEFKKIIQ